MSDDEDSFHLCGSSPPWNDEEVDASFSNQSMEVNPPSSSSPPPAISSSPAVAPHPAAPEAKPVAAEPPKTNSLKDKHPLDMLKDINESVQRVKVETVEIQAKTKIEQEKLSIAAERKWDLRQLENACEHCEHKRPMAKRQLKILCLQAQLPKQ